MPRIGLSLPVYPNTLIENGLWGDSPSETFLGCEL